MTHETGHPRRWWTLLVLVLSLVIIGLDNTILNVALPTLVRDLDASASQLQWIVDSYVLVFAGMLLTAGLLGDRYGRKRGLFIGYAIFGVGSLIAAYSDSSTMLIASRAVMGLGGAFIMPSTLSVLVNIFPPRERARAIAIWAGGAAIGIPLGPVLGGWLLEHFWWGSIFLVNVPIIVVAALAAYFLVPESRDPDASPLDIPGALLSIGGLATLLYGIIEAPSHGWASLSTILGIGLGVIMLAAFAVWEWRSRAPMLNLRFFKNPRFSAGSLSITLVFFALFGSIFFLPQYMQFVLGYDALEAGLRMTPVALGILLGTGLSTRLVEKLGSKLVVATGLTVVAAGLFILSTLTVESGYTHLATAIVVLGLGMGMTMAPATDAVMGAVPAANAGVGSAINDTTRQVGGALGVAILGSVFSTFYGAEMESVTAGLPPEVAATASDSVGGALGVAQQLGGQAGQALVQAANAGFITSMETTFVVAAGVALSGALLALLFLPARAVDTGGPESAAAQAETREVLHP